MAYSDDQNQGRGSSLEDSMERGTLFNAESKLINKGLPQRHLLNTSKQELGEHGNIKRWVLGVKNPGKKMRTIILLGETGAGKSTLINVMTTYILGVKWSDKIRYEIVKEEERHQSGSLTSKVTVYEIFGYEGVRVPFSLRVIDTPGYGDTNGERRAKKIVETLCDLFQCEVGIHLDAVCLVVRASQNRLTPHQRCIFDAVLSIFGKDTKNNIFPVITFSGEGKPAALVALDKFGFSWSRDEKNNIVNFQFNNAPEDEEDCDNSDQESEAAWDKRKKSLQAFFEYLNNLETRGLVMTHEVLVEREKLECCVRSIQDKIVQAEHQQNEIRQTQEALEKNKEEIEKNKHFEYVVEEKLQKKVESDSNATLCENCKFNCHYPCASSNIFCLWCSVTYAWDCTECPGKCSLSKHVKEKMRYVTVLKNVTRTSEQLKEKYEESSRGFESEQKIQKKRQEELFKIEREKQRLILESYNHIISLNEIALRPESLSILPNFKFLIDKLRETNQSDKAEKLEDIYKRAMEAQNIKEGEQPRFLKFITSWSS